MKKWTRCPRQGGMHDPEFIRKRIIGIIFIINTPESVSKSRAREIHLKTFFIMLISLIVVFSLEHTRPLSSISISLSSLQYNQRWLATRNMTCTTFTYWPITYCTHIQSIQSMLLQCCLDSQAFYKRISSGLTHTITTLVYRVLHKPLHSLHFRQHNYELAP